MVAHDISRAVGCRIVEKGPIRFSGCGENLVFVVHPNAFLLYKYSGGDDASCGDEQSNVPYPMFLQGPKEPVKRDQAAGGACWE